MSAHLISQLVAQLIDESPETIFRSFAELRSDPDLLNRAVPAIVDQYFSIPPHFADHPGRYYSHPETHAFLIGLSGTRGLALLIGRISDCNANVQLKTVYAFKFFEQMCAELIEMIVENPATDRWVLFQSIVACLTLAKKTGQRDEANHLIVEYCRERLVSEDPLLSGSSFLALRQLSQNEWDSVLELSLNPAVTSFVNSYYAMNYMERAKASELCPGIGRHGSVLLPPLFLTLRDTSSPIPCEVIDNLARSVDLHHAIVALLSGELIPWNSMLLNHVMLAFELGRAAYPLLPQLRALQREVNTSDIERILAATVSRLEESVSGR